MMNFMIGQLQRLFFDQASSSASPPLEIVLGGYQQDLNKLEPRMVRRERAFPPSKIADLSHQSASNFLAFLRDCRRCPVSLIIGAGVSASCGLPLWSTLLRRICATFFCHWESDVADGRGSITDAPHKLSIAFFDENSWSEDVIKASDKFIEQNALLIAQQIKNCIRDADWRYLVRKIVYNFDTLGKHGIKNSILVQNLARFCAKATSLRAVVSYNWDNVLEQELRELKVKVAPVWESKQRFSFDTLPIYYPHGYLPLQGGPVTRIILAESDYQQEAKELYSWANLVQMQAFCTSVCIFIGCSMADPNLRRLLRISSEGVSVPRKYVFLPSQSQKDKAETMYDTIFDRDLATLSAKVVRFPMNASSDDSFSRLPELIEAATQHIVDENYIWSE